MTVRRRERLRSVSVCDGVHQRAVDAPLRPAAGSSAP
ncbi:hypothetical protein BJY27_005553 [Streptomyces rapamycinicus]|uniref:Uncharacterized protein n=1 Tax=Streptomyces rapamycinicus TaxID=1226757 RepID=A0ABR6LS78_9ACTN|nr:hypothetical protein [Streptomyces rapamycinicus]